jgi:hypothetical protein
MDLFDRFTSKPSWHTPCLLEYAGTLTEEQLDRATAHSRRISTLAGGE